MLIALMKIEFSDALISFFLGYDWMLLNVSPDLNALYIYVEEQDLESHPKDNQFMLYGYEFIYLLVQQMLLFYIVSLLLVIKIVLTVLHKLCRTRFL